jgi:hypothetical protein
MDKNYFANKKKILNKLFGIINMKINTRYSGSMPVILVILRGGNLEDSVPGRSRSKSKTLFEK